MKALTILAGLALAAQAAAFPLPEANFLREDFPAHFTTNFDFEGIVALSNCSGSLVRFEHSRDTDKAMILTNGHCLETGFVAPGNIVYNRASNRRFRLLNSSAGTAGNVTATKIMYGTMTKTDMALYQVRETYAEILQSTRIRPLTLSSRRPRVGDPVQVISGYWKRGYECQLESFAHKLKEGRWTNEDSMRYSRPGCEVIGGTSGSPMVLGGSRTVIGVNNTGNMDGERCTENNPCEVDEQGNVFFEKGYSYGQQTYWVYSCLDANSEIDLNKAGCQLFKPAAAPSNNGRRFVRVLRRR